MGGDPDNLVFAVSTAVDLLIVGGAVWWGAGRTSRLLVALAAALALLALKGLLLVWAGLRLPFGVMHVAWLDLVVVAPIAGLLLVLRTRERALRVLGLVACCLAPVGAYASFVEPERLRVERATVPLAPAREGERPLRLGVMADLQFESLGGHEREAVRELMAQRPDAILIAGDFHQGRESSFERELPGLRRLLGRLHAPGGVYAVQGDVESMEEARRVVAGTGVRLLESETARVRIGDRRLTVAGLPLAYWSARSRRHARTLEAAAGERDVRVLLAHRPDAVYSLAPRTRVDLVVAGHTHGGQVQLPGIGQLTTASHVPRAVGGGGLHELAGRRIYVSRGVGVERGQAPRLRFGAPPEVAVLTLR